ncbi:unnamed protein product [Meganyctiphanes norvegica]|uniref:Carboxylesterase type B domain-containing protein n=1 Tax=Meganyctiphanes norvegica TaxID=48144 RepID=A0AAV2Q864_MEGNR
MSGLSVVGQYISKNVNSANDQAVYSHNIPVKKKCNSSWRIPYFLRKKFKNQINKGQKYGDVCYVASSQEGENVEGLSEKERLKRPESCILKGAANNSTADRCLDMGTSGAPYSQSEVQHSGYREPRYLDLFDPTVSVVRDPKLDEPKMEGKSRFSLFILRILSLLSSTRLVIACSVTVVVLVVVIAAVAGVSKSSMFIQDPRVQPPFVTTVTSCGHVRGVIEDKTYVFRGIPYAIPPVGRRRFVRSQLQTKLEDCWKGTFIANVSRPCWSYDTQGAVVAGYEDCLAIDIFTPQLGYDNPLAVVVFVGGASLGGDLRRPWLLGAASTLAVKRNIVIVSPQVRRGTLGFFPHKKLAQSTYPHSSGNQGVSDLLNALSWVRHNIEHFGGDPGRITLLGHEAGAALAWPLLTSGRGQRLVRNAWLTGAPPMHPETTWRDADPLLVEAVNCSTVQCLETISARKIMEAPPLDWRRPHGPPWLVADGVVIPFLPDIPQVPLVFGSTKQGSAEQLLPWRRRLGNSRQQLVDAVQEALKLNDEFSGGTNIWPELSREYGQDHLRNFVREHDQKESRAIFIPGGTFPNIEMGVASVGTAAGNTITGQEMATTFVNWYSSLIENPFLLLSTLVSDATTTCPVIRVASHLARRHAQGIPSSVSNTQKTPVYAYISTHSRMSRVGALADGLSDIEAILGVFRPQTRSDHRFAQAMQDMFFLFVETGSPEWYSPTPAHLGIYMVDEKYL